MEYRSLTAVTQSLAMGWFHDEQQSQGRGAINANKDVARGAWPGAY